MKVDWDSIKLEVEGTDKSVRAIALEYGISHTLVNKKIKTENWKRYVPTMSVSNYDAENPHIAVLGKTAIRKIDEVKRELGKNYSSVDEPLIVMYAKSYERYIELEKKVQQEGYISVSYKTGSTYINPTFNALQMVQKTLVTIANQLGLSMLSRKQLGLKLGNQPSMEQSIFDFANDINQLSVIDV